MRLAALKNLPRLVSRQSGRLSVMRFVSYGLYYSTEDQCRILTKRAICDKIQKMESSIDDIKQTPDTLSLPSITKTYILPKGMSLWPDESVTLGVLEGFIARGTANGKSAVLALGESQKEQRDSPRCLEIQQYLDDVVLEDFSFMRSAYYNYIAQYKYITTPNIASLAPDDYEQLESTGLSMVLATGSLETIDQSLVVSRGDELQKVADIESRAEEIGLYSQVVVRFPGDKQGVKEECIILTDAVGNRVIMPFSEETKDLLKRLFGYKEAEEQLFDAEAALLAMFKRAEDESGQQKTAQ